MSNILPYIPAYITVHLGPPDSDARNVTVPFVDYVKNVASSEIYPTWPENAIRANMYAQISYALNRIYTDKGLLPRAAGLIELVSAPGNILMGKKV